MANHGSTIIKIIVMATCGACSSAPPLDLEVQTGLTFKYELSTETNEREVIDSAIASWNCAFVKEPDVHILVTDNVTDTKNVGGRAWKGFIRLNINNLRESVEEGNFHYNEVLYYITLHELVHTTSTYVFITTDGEESSHSNDKTSLMYANYTENSTFFLEQEIYDSIADVYEANNPWKDCVSFKM